MAVGLAVGAGYVLGRTKKAKFAFAVGTMVAGKKLNLSPKALGQLVTQQLENNPQFKEIGDQLRQDLRGVGKAATGSLLNRQLEGLADRLHDRTLGVQDRISGVVPDDVKGAVESDDDKDEDEDERGDEEETSDTEGRSAESEGRSGESERSERSERSEPRRKAPAKRSASTPDAKSAPKAAAKKTAAKKAPAKKTTRNTARNTGKTAQKKSTAAARRAKGGSDHG
ncbi:DNA primase [Streptomyces sp. NPDC046465]|uniref:DNA primase n=1 Tax=Streptomyces sp. NPDC046465 TaxID=3155810 RepID=UPI0033DDEAA7